MPLGHRYLAPGCAEGEVHGALTTCDPGGVRPCAVYLRHCVLAAERMGAACYASFLDDTYLVDRSTTIRQYLAQHPEVMSTPPPPALAERYGG